MNINPVSPDIAPTTASGRADMTKEDFMKILIAEVSRQDPMAPLKNEQFLNQLTSLQSYEAVSNLSDTISSLLNAQKMGTASSMLGKFISGTSDDGSLVQGLVSKVTIKDDQILLQVNDSLVPVENVKEILPYIAQGT